jgi:hypothetical protein
MRRQLELKMFPLAIALIAVGCRAVDERAVGTMQAALTDDGKSTSGDSKSASGDDNSASGDGKSTSADGKSTSADGQSVSGDGQSVSGDGKSTSGDGKSASGDGKSPPDASQSSPDVGQSKSNDGTTSGISGMGGAGDGADLSLPMGGLTTWYACHGDPSGLQHLRCARGGHLPNQINEDLAAPPTPVGSECTSDEAASWGSCAAPGEGHPQYLMCTTENWGASEIHELAGRAAFSSPPALWPGSVVQGRYIPTGDFVPVNVRRSGGTLVFRGVVLGAGAAISDTVDEMTSATVNQAIQDTMAYGVRGEPSDASIVVTQYDNQDQFALKAGLVGRIGTAEIETHLMASHDERTTSYLVNFQQVFYTVDFERQLGSQANVFRDGDAFQDPDFTITYDNPPLYVKSVSYGRQILMATTSSYSKDEIEAAIKFVYSGVGAEAEAKHRRVVSNSTFNAIVRGGDARTTLGLFTFTGMEAFDRMRALFQNTTLAAVSPENPGVPIAYQLNYLLTDSTAELAYNVARYDQRSCALEGGIPFRFSLQAENIDDDMEVWIEDPAHSADTSHRFLAAYARLHDDVDSMGMSIVVPGTAHVDLTRAIQELNQRTGMGTEAPDVAIVRILVGNGGGWNTSWNLGLWRDGYPLWSEDRLPHIASYDWQRVIDFSINWKTGEATQLPCSPLRPGATCG